MKWHPATRVFAAGLVLLGTLPANLPASSHREAPMITTMPKASQALMTLSSRASQAGLIVPSEVKPPIFQGWCQE